MRLINTQTLQLRDFVKDVSDTSFPRYAILSHTWEDAELTFEEFQNVSKLRKKPSSKKITEFCARARKDGLDWAWIDTCCINKSSSTELSEAINSMYRWYEASTVCYAYISDFKCHNRNDPDLTALRNCRWFRRGWTLQELVAPTRVVFFDKDWKEFTTKSLLAEELAVWTGIPTSVLRHSVNRLSISVADRMSWASMRYTTRIEDMAYCLLGIFDVNMPLLYGEGTRAFNRLQAEILKTSNDDTILLGGVTHANEAGDWYSEATLPHGRWSGRLLSHPESSGKNIAVPDPEVLRIDPPTINASGLRIDLPLKQFVYSTNSSEKVKDADTGSLTSSLHSEAKDKPTIYYGALNCVDQTGQKRLARYFKVISQMEDHIGTVLYLQARDYDACWVPIEDVKSWEVLRCIISMQYNPKHVTVLATNSGLTEVDPLLTSSVRCRYCDRLQYGWTWTRRQARSNGSSQSAAFSYFLELTTRWGKDYIGLIFLAPTHSSEGAGRVVIYKLPNEEPAQVLDCVWQTVENNLKSLMAGETPGDIGGMWSDPLPGGPGPRATVSSAVAACCDVKVNLVASLYCGKTTKGNLEFRPEYRLQTVDY